MSVRSKWIASGIAILVLVAADSPAAAPTGPGIADVRPLVTSGSDGLGIGDLGTIDERLQIDRRPAGATEFYFVSAPRGLSAGSNCESAASSGGGVTLVARCFVSVRRVTVTLAGGDDTVETTAAITEATAVTLKGGADTLQTRSANDSADLGPGDDTASTSDGADAIAAGSGRDDVDAGRGADAIDGGPDGDTLSGGDGPDSFQGGDGDDKIDAKDGESVAVADALIDCGPGIDDKASVDLTDPIASSCETVARGAIGEGPNVAIAAGSRPSLRHGTLAVQATCPAALGHPCAGNIVAARSEAGLEGAPEHPYSIAAGHDRTLRFTPAPGLRPGHGAVIRAVEPGDVRGVKTTLRRVRLARR